MPRGMGRDETLKKSVQIIVTKFQTHSFYGFCTI